MTLTIIIGMAMVTAMACTLARRSSQQWQDQLRREVEGQ
jgi:hypothetical protein